MERASYIIYRSFAEVMDELSDEDAGRLFKAVSAYALDGVEPELSGFLQGYFRLMKPQLDANRQKYENGCKGGRPETKSKPSDNQTETKPKPRNNQTETKQKPNDNLTESKPKANDNDNVNDNHNVNVNDNANEEAEENARARAKAAAAVIASYESETKNCARFLRVSDLTTKARTKLEDEVNASLLIYSDYEIKAAIQKAAQSDFLKYKIKWRPGLSWILDNIDDLVGGKYSEPLGKIDQLAQIEQLALRGGTG